MSEQTYQGGCHCGAVRYEIKIDLPQVLACNCSICSKKGTLLAFAPRSNFSLKSGEDNLTDYQFNKKVIHHLFCSTCGVTSFGHGTGPDGTEMAAINVRCLDDVDFQNIPVHHVDGKSF